MKRLILELSGIVQGVGFRPFIYNLAHRLGLKGYVSNNLIGVNIDVQGDKDNLHTFLSVIKGQSPPLANIVFHSISWADKIINYSDFEIKESHTSNDRSQTLAIVSITPDIATCSDCLSELKDINDRRFGYPFINCTNCGPRLTILEDLPYDRQNTTMRRFNMCKVCQEEYEDVRSRRFHAQPNACQICGPHLSLYGKDRLLSEGERALKTTIEYLKEGAIISIKGIGGFHLCCDATNDYALRLLRKRKNRPLKPLAVMFRDIETIKSYGELSLREQALIGSKERPVTIINKKDITDLSEGIAPGLRKIGVILPYSPLHFLICEELSRPLVMTSANLGGEPIVKDNKEALEGLFGLSDYILLHNRDIINHCDDSVVKEINQTPLFIRRSRGYAAAPITLPISLNKKILAVGGNQKSVIALGQGNKAIASQYIGELDDVSAQARFREVIDRFLDMYSFIPDILVCDKHPHYYSTKWAKTNPYPSIGIQHHYAHALSLMADNGIDERGEILAVTWDGTGYGDDGNIWGGEFLLSSYHHFERLYHLDYFRLIGGEKAVKEPKRVALSLLLHIYGRPALEKDFLCLKSFSDIDRDILFTAWEKGINSPLCSSVGRIFDGAASLLNILGDYQEISYDGQCGMMMEDMYIPRLNDHYPYEIKDGKILWQGFISALIEDRSDKDIIVTRFINTLAKIVTNIAEEVGKPIGLSGGVFQNSVLTQKIIELGVKKGITILTHKNVPANDGGLFLGQLIYGGFNQTQN